MKLAPTTPYGYSRMHRVVEILCIGAVFALLIGFSIQIPRTIESPGGWVNLVLTGLTSYIATDMMSGIGHWAGDTLGHERIWFAGPNFIRPFREHHVDQKAITRHDFIETNGNNCIVLVGPLGLAFGLMPSGESFGFFSATFVAFMSLFGVATNQFHKWAHADSPPAIARPLQRWGLILSPRHHEIHHTTPHDRHYCITVGWMNPVLNGLRFFRTVEWLIGSVRPSWLYTEERALAAKSATADAATAITATMTATIAAAGVTVTNSATPVTSPGLPVAAG